MKIRNNLARDKENLIHEPDLMRLAGGVAMNDQWIRSFQEIARMNSINKAARNLFITPQALVQQADQLEREVGVRLFERNNRGTFLTDAGKEFRDGIKEVERLYAQTLQRCRGMNLRQTLRIPVCSNVAAPVFLEKTAESFGKLQDQYTIELVQTAFDIDAWIDGLFLHQYDIIEFFSLRGNHPSGTYYRKCTDISTWCLMSKDHPLAKEELITLDMLADEHVVSPGIELMGYVQRYAEENGVTLSIEAIPVERFHILRTCAEGGICFMSYDAALALPNLEKRPLDCDTNIEVGLCCLETHVDEYRQFFDAAIELLQNERATPLFSG